MSTGDLKNCGTKLQSLLRIAKYPAEINYSFLFYGYPQEFLPLLHFIFQEYSLPFTKSLLKKGYKMSGKSDKQFVETVYKILRDEFQYIPKLGKDKFFNNGFTEQKLILTSTAFQYVLDNCRSAKKQKTKQANKENTNPIDKIKTSNHTSLAFPDLPDEVLPATTALAAAEHTPIRKPPTPHISQPYDASLYIDESIIVVPDVTLDASEEHPIRLYSEEGAREIFAQDHLTAMSELEVVDSTPKTVVTDVQFVPMSTNYQNIPSLVVKEVAEQWRAELSAEGEDKSGISCVNCCHSEELSEIKNLLVTMNARLDILESKSNHSESQRLKSLSDFQNLEPPFTTVMPPKAREVSFLLPGEEMVGEYVEEETVVSMLNSTDSSDEEEEDVKNFLKSVSEKLSNTRSFLRTYDSSS